MLVTIKAGELAGHIGRVMAHADGQALVRIVTLEGGRLAQAWVPDGEYE